MWFNDPVYPDNNEMVFLDTYHGWDIGFYDIVNKLWIILGHTNPQVYGWCSLEYAKDLLKHTKLQSGWKPFTHFTPPKDRLLLVWDVRHNAPTLIYLDSENIMTEERTSKRYHVDYNMWYSHWRHIDLPNLLNRVEMEEWIKTKGIRIGID